MTERLVVVGGTEIYVEVADGGGPATIAEDGPLAFDRVRDAISGLSAELVQAWQGVKPDEASVEFGLRLTAKSGRLTGLLVEGGGEASLTVRLTWRSTPPEMGAAIPLETVAGSGAVQG